MKKRIFAASILLILAFFALAGCGAIGLPGRKTFDGKTAELIENWDGSSDVGEWRESESSGTYTQAEGGMVDIRFAGNKGLRYTIPMGTGDELSGILPDGAEDIFFGAVFVPWENIGEDWKENFIENHVYENTLHRVLSAEGDRISADISGLDSQKEYGLTAVLTLQERNYDKKIAARGFIKYRIGEEIEYIYADDYFEANLYEILYNEYLLKRKSDAAGFITGVVDNVRAKRKLQKKIAASLAADASLGDYKSGTTSLEEGAAYDFTADTVSVIYLTSENEVKSGIRSMLGKLIASHDWSACFEGENLSASDIGFRAYVDGKIQRGYSVNTILSALEGEGENASILNKDVKLVVSSTDHQDFFTLKFRVEPYVKLFEINDFVYDGTDKTSEVARIIKGEDVNLSFESSGVCRDAREEEYSVKVTAENCRILSRESNEYRTVKFTVSPKEIEVFLCDREQIYGHGELSLSVDESASTPLAAGDSYADVVFASREAGTDVRYDGDEIVGYAVSGEIINSNYRGVVHSANYVILKAPCTESEGWAEIAQTYDKIYERSTSSIDLPGAYWRWKIGEEADENSKTDQVGEHSYLAEYFYSPNYHSTEREITVNVTPADYDMSGISFGSAVYVYNGTVQRPDIEGALPVGLDGKQVTVTYSVDPIGAGEYTVTAEFSTPSQNYFVPASLSAEVTIEKAPLLISANPAVIVYGQTPINNGAVIGGFVPGDTAGNSLAGNLVFSYTYETYGNIGNYDIIPSGLSSANYAITWEKGDLSVLAKPVYRLVWETGEIKYDGDSHRPEALADGVVNGDECRAIYNIESVTDGGIVVQSAKNAGLYKMTASGLDNPNYRLAEGAEGSVFTFEISKRNLTVTAAKQTAVYSGAEPAVSSAPQFYAVGGDGIISGEDIGIIFTKSAGATHGVYDLEADWTDKRNYSVTFENLGGGFEIVKAPYSMAPDYSGEAFENIVAVYGDKINEVAFFTDYAGAQAATVWAWEYQSGNGWAAYPYGQTVGHVGGENIFSAHFIPSNDNYEDGFIDVAVEVLPKLVTFTWIKSETDDDSDLTYVYDSTEKLPFAIVHGLLPGDECHAAISGGKVNAGEDYTATVTALSNPDYAIDELTKNAVFCVKKATFALSFNNIVNGGVTVGATENAGVFTATTMYGGSVIEHLGTAAANVAEENLEYRLYKVAGENEIPCDKIDGEGVYALYVSGEDMNHCFGERKLLLTVNAFNLSYSWQPENAAGSVQIDGDISHEYTGGGFTFVLNADVSLGVDMDALEISVEEKSGDYWIAATGATVAYDKSFICVPSSVNKEYRISAKWGNLDTEFVFGVIPRRITLSLSAGSVYCGEAVDVSGVFLSAVTSENVAGMVAGESISFEYGCENVKDFKEDGYFVTATPTGGDYKNYEITYDVRYYIIKRPVTVYVGDVISVYDGSAHTPAEAQITIEPADNGGKGLIPGDDLNVQTAGDSLTNVGTTEIYCAFHNDNYEVIWQNTTPLVIVGPRDLYVSSDSYELIYGDDVPDISSGVKAIGFIAGESFSDISGEATVSTDYVKFSHVGEYPVSVSGYGAEGSVNGNYRISYVCGTIEVGPYRITADMIVWDETALTATYKAGVFAPPQAAFIRELSDGETAVALSVEFEDGSDGVSDSGAYPVVIKGVKQSADYILADGLGSALYRTFSVQKATLNLSVEEATGNEYLLGKEIEYNVSVWSNQAGDSAGGRLFADGEEVITENGKAVVRVPANGAIEFVYERENYFDAAVIITLPHVYAIKYVDGVNVENSVLTEYDAGNNEYSAKSISADNFAYWTIDRDPKPVSFAAGDSIFVYGDAVVLYAVYYVPTPTVENLVYNGSAQTGVRAAVGYENHVLAEGSTGKNAGGYRATVALKDTENYVWKGADYFAGELEIDWQILPARLNMTVTPDNGNDYLFGGSAKFTLELSSPDAPDFSGGRLYIGENTISVGAGGAFTVTLSEGQLGAVVLNSGMIPFEYEKDNFNIAHADFLTSGIVCLRYVTDSGVEDVHYDEIASHTFKTTADSTDFAYWVKMGETPDFANKVAILNLGDAAVILRAVYSVSVPALTQDLIYNGGVQVAFTAGEDVIIDGYSAGKNAGEYQATLTLSNPESRVWKDGDEYLTGPVELNWEIERLPVSLAWTGAADMIFNGQKQAPRIAVQGVLPGERTAVLNAIIVKITAERGGKNYVCDLSRADGIFGGIDRGDYTVTAYINESAEVLSNYDITNAATFERHRDFTINRAELIVGLVGTSRFGDGAPSGVSMDSENPDCAGIIAFNDLRSLSPGEYRGAEIGGIITILNDNYSVVFTQESAFIVEKRLVSINLSYDDDTGDPVKATVISSNVLGNDILLASIVGGSYDPVFKTVKITLSGTRAFGYAPVGGVYESGDVFIIEADSDVVNWSDEFYGAKLIRGIDYSSAKQYFTLADVIGEDLMNATAGDISAEITDGNVTFDESAAVNAGGTYRVTLRLTNSLKRFAHGQTSLVCYVKFKTASVGGVPYTIEDAINKTTGDIILSGNASASGLYTRFSSLSDEDYSALGYNRRENITVEYSDDDGHTIIKAKRAVSTYDISGRTIYLPYSQSSGIKTGQASSTSAYPDYVYNQTETNRIYAVLFVNEGVRLTFGGSAAGYLTIDGKIISKGQGKGYNGAADDRSVVVCDGVMDFYTGSVLRAFGYLKTASGKGVINLRGGSVAWDVMRIHDWTGGTYASNNISSEFLLNAFTMHSVSCPTKIYAGGTYKVHACVNAGSGERTTTATIIGDSASLFEIKDGYILKTALDTLCSDQSQSPLRSPSGRNQYSIGEKDVISIYGNAIDNKLSMRITISIFSTEIKASTNPHEEAPIGYMDVIVGDGGVCTLKNMSYKFLPGASLTVNAGGKLIVEKDVNLMMCSVNIRAEAETGLTQPEHAFVNFNYALSDEDAALNVLGTAVIKGSIGGKINASADGARLEFVPANQTNDPTIAEIYALNAPAYGTDSDVEYIASSFMYMRAFFAKNGTSEVFAPGRAYAAEDGNWVPLDETGLSELTIYSKVAGGEQTQSVLSVWGVPTMYDLARKGYMIAGVFTDSGYSEEYDFSAASESGALYVLYEAEKYAINYESLVFDADLSELQLQEEYAIDGGDIILPSASQMNGAFADRGVYAFVGWLDGNYRRIYKITPGEYLSDITVYALWNADVTLNLRFSDMFSGDDYTGETVTVSVGAKDLATFDGGEKYDDVINGLRVNWQDERYLARLMEIAGTIISGAGESEFDVVLYREQFEVTTYYLDLSAGTGASINSVTIVSTGTVIAGNNKIYEIPLGQSVNVILTIQTGNNGYTVGKKVTVTSGNAAVDGTDDDFTITPAGLSDGDTVSVTWTYTPANTSCFAEDTLVTLADGSQKQVKDLLVTDKLLVFNHETGAIEAGDILFIDKDCRDDYRVLTLEFSDGSTVKVIGEHGFFDKGLNKYVYIDEFNADYFVGREFIGVSGGERTIVRLVGYGISTENTVAYSPVTAYHLNYFVGGMLSMPAGITGLFNIFELDENMTYDERKMAEDIERYGLYTYEDFEAYVPYEIYEVFNAQYLKVSVGKGLMTFEDILALIERYSAQLGITEE